MYYLVMGYDYPDGLERRQKSREAHLEGAKKLKEEGKLLYAVAMIEKGKMKGSVMVMSFESDEEFNDWKASEPYVTGDVWERVEVMECAIPPLFK